MFEKYETNPPKLCWGDEAESENGSRETALDAWACGYLSVRCWYWYCLHCKTDLSSNHLRSSPLLWPVLHHAIAIANTNTAPFQGQVRHFTSQLWKHWSNTIIPLSNLSQIVVGAATLNEMLNNSNKACLMRTYLYT